MELKRGRGCWYDTEGGWNVWIKWRSGSVETGQREQSFGGIDGDEAGLEVPPTLITPRWENRPRVCFSVCFFFFLVYSSHATAAAPFKREVALTSGGIQTILKHSAGLFRLAWTKTPISAPASEFNSGFPGCFRSQFAFGGRWRRGGTARASSRLLENTIRHVTVADYTSSL